MLYLILLVPGEPRRVKAEALNSTAINIQWRPPADREHNGVIRGYLITYTQLDERDGREEQVGPSAIKDIMNGMYFCPIIIYWHTHHLANQKTKTTMTSFKHDLSPLRFTGIHANLS